VEKKGHQGTQEHRWFVERELLEFSDILASVIIACKNGIPVQALKSLLLRSVPKRKTTIALLYPLNKG